MTKKYVYFFGGPDTEGSADMRNLLGGKGANLAEMARIGIPVPAGFTITTEVCTLYYQNNQQYPEGLEEQVAEAMKRVEEVMGAKFADTENPLLVSVRSGARVSMPGMMDTVLNIGLNDETIKGFIAQSGNERAAYDSYRRLVQMYSNVVLGVPHEEFEAILDEKKKEVGAELDTDLTTEDLKDLVVRFKALVKEKTGQDFPEDPYDQLWGAIGAVFRSWNNPRAIVYRQLNKIPDDWGTAVNVVAMVFGNMGDDSGTGVAFTRDPSTGEKIFYGEFLFNAQGEDVVAGIRTPLPLNRDCKTDPNQISFEEAMPDIYQELLKVREILERHYKDMQDIEFTVQKKRLWLLQTRTGKRTAMAALRIAVDMVEEGLITKEEAVLRVDPEQLDQLLHPVFDSEEKKKALAENRVVAKGLNASPGAATGRVVFDPEEAAEMAEQGEDVILVRLETSPDDIRGMAASRGVLTARGGMTSHAAVVARGMGKPCVAGCSAIQVDYDAELFRVDTLTVRKGEYISIDGTTGEVIIGKVPTVESDVIRVARGEIKPEDSLLYQYYSKLMSWADEIRELGVRTNADTPEDAELARQLGAQGIGLTRTEHMFFAEDRLPVMQEMILAKTLEEREAALAKLLPMQKEDFKGILRAMDGLPVIIRLLDPPLHEFLPRHEDLLVEIAVLEATNGDPEKIRQKRELLEKVEALREMNPMLGHRGCRLGVTNPEVYNMQVRAIFEAACELAKEGYNPIPEVMIPLVGHVNELRILKKNAEKVAEEVMEQYGVRVEYMIGTMIELPRAAITAHEIAQEAEFFSFGTNDLTQTTFGFSRDDIEGKFLPDYLEKKILPANPFAVLDRDGVGELIKMGIERGRKTRPDLEVGICGEHGGEPSSVEFCHIVGMNYVSCSPYRVPIARLAAAQAAVRHPRAAVSA